MILQTGNGPWHFTTVDDGVLFDMDGDGDLERTAWTRSDSSLAFLALDLDGSGTIESARELFGTHTMMPAGSAASNGFVALQQYDTNGDTVIDQRDIVWSALLLWKDLNHDGKTQPIELQSLAAAGFRALETGHHWLNRRDPNGNSLRFKAFAHDEMSGTRPYYDVFFQAGPD